MKIDLHIHENTYSKDSQLSLEHIVFEARRRGLDAIAITDHDVMGHRHQARFLSARYQMPIFVGVEVNTTLGDLLVFGVDALPEMPCGQRLEPQALIDYVNGQGGAVIAAHPFRDNGRGLGDALRHLKGLTAIEGYNGRTGAKDNQRAAELAQTLGIPITGGSDAHSPGEVGGFATWFHRRIETEKDLIQALKLGFCQPVTSLVSVTQDGLADGFALLSPGFDEELAV